MVVKQKVPLNQNNFKDFEPETAESELSGYLDKYRKMSLLNLEKNFFYSMKAKVISKDWVKIYKTEPQLEFMVSKAFFMKALLGDVWSAITVRNKYDSMLLDQIDTGVFEFDVIVKFEINNSFDQNNSLKFGIYFDPRMMEKKVLELEEKDLISNFKRNSNLYEKIKAELAIYQNIKTSMPSVLNNLKDLKTQNAKLKFQIDQLKNKKSSDENSIPGVYPKNSIIKKFFYFIKRLFS